MAELERIANHLGDFGAICNDASFALLHAHCGMLREKTLRAADAAFGHRLMRDRIVPGGVAADLDAAGLAAIQMLVGEVRARLPALVELYDNTASLQDRTVSTGHLDPVLAAPICGRRLCRPRLGPRLRRAPRSPAIAPYDRLAFDVPVLDGRRRQCARLDPDPRDRAEPVADRRSCCDGLPGGPLPRRAAAAGEAREGMALVEGFRGDILVWLRLDPDNSDRALPLARSRPGSSGRCSKRSIEGNIVADFPLCNKSFNCSYSGPRSLRPAMRKLLFQSLIEAPLTEAAPCRATPRWPKSRRRSQRVARRRLGRSLSIREVDAGSCNGCELEIHALNNAFYDIERFGLRFVASPRHADVLLVTGPVTKNMREALERTYNATPDPEMGGRGRRLRPRRRLLRRQLCRRRRRLGRHPRRPPHPRLPARARSRS